MTLRHWPLVAALCILTATTTLLLSDNTRTIVVERVPPNDRLEYEAPALIDGDPATCQITDRVEDGVRVLGLADCERCPDSSVTSRSTPVAPMCTEAERAEP